MTGDPYYEAIWEQLPDGLRPERLELRRAFLLANVTAGERALDLGCGEGVFAAELVRAGAQVVAADVAQEPLRRATARVPGLDVRLLGDGAWPLDDAGFDVVWAGEVIEHVHDTAAWLSEVRRVLTPGGRLLLSTPNLGRAARARLVLSERAFAARMDPLSDHLRFYSRRTLAELIEGFGFERVEVRSAGWPPLARPQLLARAVRARF